MNFGDTIRQLGNSATSTVVEHTARASIVSTTHTLNVAAGGLWSVNLGCLVIVFAPTHGHADVFAGGWL